MDLELTVDVAGLAAAAGAELTRGDVCLLKFVLSSALYPNIALPAIGNMHRRYSQNDSRLPLFGKLAVTAAPHALHQHLLGKTNS
jgi:hypothetical protein